MHLLPKRQAGGSGTFKLRPKGLEANPHLGRETIVPYVWLDGERPHETANEVREDGKDVEADLVLAGLGVSSQAEGP